jgi:hypothetical protein
MLAWKSAGTRLYQELPAAMRASWRAVEPLREIPADRPTQAAVLRTWQQTRGATPAPSPEGDSDR